MTGGRGLGTRVGSSPPNGIEGLCPARRPEPRPALGTEILRWSDRREPAEALLRPRRSLVTLPCHQADRNRRAGPFPREEVTCRITWLGRPRIERLGCAPDGSLGGRADRHRSRSHQRNWGAKSRDERSWREKCSAHVKSSIGGQWGARILPIVSRRAHRRCHGSAGLGRPAGTRLVLPLISRHAPTVVQPIGPSRSAISGVMKGFMNHS